jgi:hypothetical protein
MSILSRNAALGVYIFNPTIYAVVSMAINIFVRALARPIRDLVEGLKETYGLQRWSCTLNV